MCGATTQQDLVFSYGWLKAASRLFFFRVDPSWFGFAVAPKRPRFVREAEELG